MLENKGDFMAWLKKERVKSLNLIIELLKQGPMEEEEVIRKIMQEYWISRTTAKRYIEDLIFMGKITRNNKHLKLTVE